MGDFNSVTPTWVHPIETSYNVYSTQNPFAQKSYFLLSNIPRRRFKLMFSGVTDGDFAGILSHWQGVSGAYSSFTWTTVPSYIDGGGGLGASLSGRWVGEPKWIPKSNSWGAEMVFEVFNIGGFSLLLETGDFILQEDGLSKIKLN